MFSYYNGKVSAIKVCNVNSLHNDIKLYEVIIVNVIIISQ